MKNKFYIWKLVHHIDHIDLMSQAKWPGLQIIFKLLILRKKFKN